MVEDETWKAFWFSCNEKFTVSFLDFDQKTLSAQFKFEFILKLLLSSGIDQISVTSILIYAKYANEIPNDLGLIFIEC